jgi:hypothetical protein
MRAYLRRGMIWSVVCASVLALSTAMPSKVHAQNLQTLAGNHLLFGGGSSEVEATFTNIFSDPVNFYRNTVTAPASIDVLFVTLSATGDTHGNNAEEVQCVVDGTPCETGNIGSDNASGAGWVVLQRNEADEHDNTVHYTWCVPIGKTKKNKHDVKLNLANLANGSSGESVFLEQINVFVQGAHFGKRLADQACTTTGSGDDTHP